MRRETRLLAFGTVMLGCGLGATPANAQLLPRPPLSCATGQDLLDFDQNPWGEQAGQQLTESYVVGGTSFQFTVSGDTNRMQSFGGDQAPRTTNVTGGGSNPQEASVLFFANNATVSEQVRIEVLVGQPGIGVSEFQVPFFDVDVLGADAPYGWQDRVTFEGYLGAQQVTAPSFVTNVTNFASGSSVLGENANAGQNSSDGTAIATFSEPVDRVVMVYGSGPDSQADPVSQFVAMHDIAFCRSIDRADAPATYGEPTHLIENGVFIGTVLPDNEPTARHSADARGDDDEGGEAETAWPDLYPDEGRALTVPVAGANGRLSAWVDWNRDGIFASNEQVATDVVDADGDGQVTLDVQTPDGTALGQTYARLRWSTQAGLGPTGAASDGEVEDARVTITSPPAAGGPGTPLPPQSCPGREARLDWDDPANAWPQGADTRQYLIGGTRLDFARSYSDGRATDTRPNSWPRTGIGKTGGLSPAEATLRIGPDMRNDAHSTTLAIDIGEPGIGLEDLRFEVFDLDASAPGPDQAREKLQVRGFLNGAPVAPPTVTTNAATVDEGGGTAGGTRPSDASADGTAGFSFAGRVDRVELTYGGRNDGQLSQRQSIGLHDIRYCAARDFGDAPASYASASHRITPGLRIGPEAPDADAAMRDSSDADGDDLAGRDDETNGLVGTLTKGTTATIAVPVTEPSPGGAYLQAWIDWAGDGSFAQTGDRIAADRRDRNGDGIVTLTVPVPATATAGQAIARFRWSSRTALGRAGEAPDGEVEDHAVTIAEPGTRRITGRVLIDDGRGGGTAHDGLGNGTEIGRSSRSVLVTDEAGATLATLTTDGEGRFVYPVPDGIAPGTRLTFTSEAGPGFADVSKSRNGNASVGNNGTIANLTAPGMNREKAILFGQVPDPTLTASRAQQVEPGGVAAFTHRYAPGTAGSVAFALGAPNGPAASRFSGTLMLDADCDGQVGASEGPPPAGLAVTATDEVCLIVRVAADPSAQEGAAASLPLSAALTRANGATAATVSNDDQVTVSRDGGATLTKEVCNADRTSCDLASGAGFTAQNGGAPGERLVYRIVFTAAGANAVRGVTITDTTPLYSSLVGETVRVAEAPPTLSCAVTPASGSQTDGYTGPVEWRCTGDLQPGSEGVAAFEVRIDP